MRAIVDEIAKRAAENAFAPALISQLGSITYEELLETIFRIENFFDDRRVPRMARAYLNIREPEIRTAVTIAAIEYGLVPAFAAPETLKRDFDYDLTIGARSLLRTDVPVDLMIDQAVLGGRFSDNKRRTFDERGDDDLALLTETTGTTGYPKLIGMTQKALRSNFGSYRRRYDRATRGMFAMGGISRYAHEYAIAMLASGGAVVSTPVDPIAALTTMAIYEVSDFLTTPAGITRILEAMEAHHARLPALKSIGLSGSLVSGSLLERIEVLFPQGVEVTTRYGTSEASRIAAGKVTAATYRRGYVGEIRESVTIVSVGTRDRPAEIVIANDLAYQTQYLVSGKAVVDDRPTLTLPDLGFVEGTSLFLIGRADEVFNYSGNKLPFDTLCQAIERQAQIRDVGVAAGGPIGRNDDLIIAIAADQPLDLGVLRDRVADALGWASAKGHFLFFQVGVVPRNATGKVDRDQLLNAYAATQRPSGATA